MKVSLEDSCEAGRPICGGPGDTGLLSCVRLSKGPGSGVVCAHTCSHGHQVHLWKNCWKTKVSESH